MRQTRPPRPSGFPSPTRRSVLLGIAGTALTLALPMPPAFAGFARPSGTTRLVEGWVLRADDPVPPAHGRGAAGR